MASLSGMFTGWKEGHSFWQWRSHLVPLLGGGFSIIVIIVMVIGWAILQAKTDARRTAIVSTTNLSRTLTNDFIASIRQADLGLLSIQNELKRQQQQGQWDDGQINAALSQQDLWHPEVGGFRIIGPDGKLRYAVKNVASHNPDLSERDDFRLLRDSPDSGLVISFPVLGQIMQQWVIVLGRRIDNPDGSFGGVVFAPIPVQALTRNFTALNVGEHGDIALYSNDFKLVARVPDIAWMSKFIGTSTLSKQLHDIIESGVSEAQYDYTSVIDGTSRIAAVRKVGETQYYILVALGEKDYLAEWRRNSGRFLVFGAIMVALVLMAMALLHRRISAQHLAIASLAESEEKLRGLFELSPLGIVRIAIDGHFMEFNEAFREITGYDDDELKALDDNALTPEKYQEEQARQTALLRTTGRYGPYRKEYICKDGSLVPLQLRGMLMIGSDGSLSLWSLVENISERVVNENAMRVKTELLTQSNADLEQFAYVASHDLQTPLRNMVRYAQLLERQYKGQLNVDADDYIGVIVDGGKRMTRLIADLLEYSRISSPQKPLQPTPIGEAVAQALVNLRLDLEKAGAEVSVGNLPSVLGEASLLVSLFQNLLGNSLKYRAPDRKALLSVTAERAGAGWWRFAIADNGIGINTQYFEKVFEIFQRLDPASGTEGTGIGLALCRRIVHRFGGSIWLESALGQGTTVFFTLQDGGEG